MSCYVMLYCSVVLCCIVSYSIIYISTAQYSIVQVGRPRSRARGQPTGPASHKGPPEYCQDGTVTHLNYDRIL